MVTYIPKKWEEPIPIQKLIEYYEEHPIAKTVNSFINAHTLGIWNQLPGVINQISKQAHDGITDTNPHKDEL